MKIPIFCEKCRFGFNKKEDRFLFWKMQSRFYKKYKLDFFIKKQTRFYKENKNKIL